MQNKAQKPELKFFEINKTVTNSITEFKTKSPKFHKKKQKNKQTNVGWVALEWLAGKF